MATESTNVTCVDESPIIFARNLFRALNEEKLQVNMVISPAAVRSGLTLIFMGAGGKSAEELRSGLMLGRGKKTEIAKCHAELYSKEYTCSDEGVALRIVTRLFVKDSQELRTDFNLKAVEFFNTQAELISFDDVDRAARYVNKWIEVQTFRTVQNLLMPIAFNVEASVIFVNSIYFRAKWSKCFAVELTSSDNFWVNATQRMEVPMMHQTGQFRYGESKKLNARILLLPFEDSNISMLFVIPRDINGLADLEAELALFDLNDVAAKTLMSDVDICIPKFKIECDIDLKMPLAKLGITSIFESGADLSNLFTKKNSQVISEARQKLFLDINETGCAADHLTNAQVEATTTIPNTERKVFKANRPFVFAIRNNQTVYFAGHYLKP